ncbi:hypothetical protein DOY81_014241 [Sarcophaga bullata]|nr:hypothetical protein DOY81_014241 [Sarcophaga bullata]
MKALPHCTHLMYGFGHLMPRIFNVGDIKLKPEPVYLKLKFPHLKIFLSLGGDKATPDAYMQLLEADKQTQNDFLKEIKNFLKVYHFDGLDLAFPFPRNKPRKVHSGADKHKQQYTDLVTEIGEEFAKDKLNLSMTVLPNVNSTWYFDIKRIQKHFQFINLFAFDFLTPVRNREEADYTAALHYKSGTRRLEYANVEYQVSHWIRNGCPSHKLNLGIATYGQAWAMTVKSGLSGVPVIQNTQGPAKSSDPILGIINWSEICTKLKSKSLLQHKVLDEQRKYATYAFSPAKGKGRHGIWISFDDPEFAGIKAEYVKTNNLGGVALYDLQHDDFAAACRQGSYPILKSIGKVLGITKQVKK